MTTIAWDGKTLAADKRISFGSLPAVTTKVHRIDGALVAGCGEAALIQEMLQWLRDGAKPADYPARQRDPKENATVLLVRANGDVRQYETSPHPLVIENEFWAVGSGRDFAMAAMHLGCDARRAVLVASEFDTGTGNGVDTLTHFSQ